MAKKNQQDQNGFAIETSHWDKQALKKIVAGLRGRKILVIGDVGIDRYTIGAVERISPEAPVPIVRVEEEQLKLGLAANVADNIQTLGGLALLVGFVGRDRGAQDCKKLLRSAGIRANYLIEDSNRRTVLKERLVSDKQQLLRVDYESTHPVRKGATLELLRKFKELVSKCDAVILQDYSKGVATREVAASVFKEAARTGKSVFVDPNAKTPLEFYRGASVLTPNTKEAEALSGVSINDEQTLRTAGEKILKITAAKHVVITRGREGMAIFSSGSAKVRFIPTYAREVFDVSGAGDTVISVLSLAQAAGATIEEAAILGNLAAGVEVGKRGTATVSPEEVLLALEFFTTQAGRLQEKIR